MRLFCARRLLPAVAGSAFLLLAGCSLLGEGDGSPESGRYAYTAYDSSGTAVVKGTLVLDFRKADAKGRNRFLLEGTRDLEQVGAVAYAERHVGEGPLSGSVGEDGSVWIDLTPRVEDSNVILRGEFEGRRLEGQWRYVGFAGTRESGRFEAEWRIVTILASLPHPE